MKFVKIISFILTLALCMGLLASCGGVDYTANNTSDNRRLRNTRGYRRLPRQLLGADYWQIDITILSYAL